MRSLVILALLASACVCTEALAAESVPVRGRFSGHTSQPGRFYKVRFRVHGSQIKDEKFVWLAPCRRGGFLRTATSQGRTRIVIERGAWSAPGSYNARLGNTGYKGHFEVVRNRGEFMGLHRARGSFRVKVRVFRHGRPYDYCDTGVIHWTARARR